MYIRKFSVILKAQGFSLDVPELKRAAVLNAVKVKGAAAGRGHSADAAGIADDQFGELGVFPWGLAGGARKTESGRRQGE